MGIDVQKIAEMAVAAHDALQAKTEFRQIALPSDYVLHDLERFDPVRNQFRGLFSTSRVADFADYYHRFNRGDTPCFVDPDAMSARVYFDIGSLESPGHCKHVAALEMQRTTAYRKGVIESNGKLFSQADLFNFIQDWQTHLTAIDHTGEEITNGRSAQIIRNIDIKRSMDSNHEDSDFSVAKSTSARIEAQAANGSKLPSGFVFSCKPYDSLKQRDFFLRLSLHDSGGDKVLLKLRCEGFDAIEDEMRDEFVELLSASISSVAIGTFDAK